MFADLSREERRARNTYEPKAVPKGKIQTPLTGENWELSIQCVTKETVDHAGLSQLSHPWRDSITSRVEISLTSLSSSALTVILSLMDAREDGRTIACGMSMTMVASPLQMTTVLLIGMSVQSRSTRSTTFQDTLRLLFS